jgi:hypothetical protein
MKLDLDVEETQGSVWPREFNLKQTYIFALINKASTQCVYLKKEIV